MCPTTTQARALAGGFARSGSLTHTGDKDDAPSVRPRQASMGRGHASADAPRRKANTDEVKLIMLGYKQELAREFTLFNCFGSGFTAMSTLTCLGGTYGTIGMTYGGPRVMMWGWLVVTAFSFSVAISMAELASAYPTSGALYYWSYVLAPPRLRCLACWLTAWVLTAAQAAFSATNIYTFVYVVSAAVEVQHGVQISDPQRLGVLLLTVAVVGLLNCGSARLTAFMTSLGTFWHIVGLAALCVTLPLVAPERQSAKYIFTSWQPNTEVTGISSPVYTTLVGLLMAQMTLTGYDGPAHVSEETRRAQRNVPLSILLTMGAAGATGFALLAALTSVKLDVEALFDPANETGGGNVVLQILIEASRPSGDSAASDAVALYTVFIIGTFFAAYQSVANNSRMLYALARDSVVPLSRRARRVHPRSRAPVAAVAYMLSLATLLSAPMCFNFYVYNAVTSFAVVGCYIAYALPVLCKLSTGTRFFLPGPFSLGPRLSIANNLLTSAWVGTVTVLFVLPQLYPVQLVNMNWAGPILGLVLATCLAWFYFPRYGAVHWFIGPRANLGQFQDVLPSELARKVAEEEAAQAAEAEAAEKAARAAEAAAQMLSRVMAGHSSSAGGGLAELGGRGSSGGGAAGGSPARRSVQGARPSPGGRISPREREREQRSKTVAAEGPSAAVGAFHGVSSLLRWLRVGVGGGTGGRQPHVGGVELLGPNLPGGQNPSSLPAEEVSGQENGLA